MIINPALWTGIPKAVRCLLYLENSLHLLARRPVLGKQGYIFERIDHDQQVTQAFVDTIGKLIDQIEESNGNQYLLQRPDDFDGKMRPGDIIWAKDGEYLQVEEVTTTHIAGTNPRGIKMDYHKSWVSSVNGVAFSYQKKPATALIAEVHNQNPVDGERAIEILKGMV